MTITEIDIESSPIDDILDVYIQRSEFSLTRGEALRGLLIDGIHRNCENRNKCFDGKKFRKINSYTCTGCPGEMYCNASRGLNRKKAGEE